MLGGIKIFKGKVTESVLAVIPITAIVLLLSATVAPIDPGVLTLFIFGALAITFGMSLFTLGAGMSMQPLGEGIGVVMSKSKKTWLNLIVCFVMGVLITIAEPDLQVLAQQIPSVPNTVIIMFVAVGVGLFIVVSMLRTKFSVRLNYLLIAFYIIAMALAFFAPNEFIPAAFDSGGVTTGPITVPFIMALGAGMASLHGSHHGEDSFGTVAFASVGPIMSVLSSASSTLLRRRHRQLPSQRSKPRATRLWQS